MAVSILLVDKSAFEQQRHSEAAAEVLAAVTAALDSHRRLARSGQHRRPIPDLLIAAAAIEPNATASHYDKDFDLIAWVSGQATRWIISRGTGHGG